MRGYNREKTILAAAVIFGFSIVSAQANEIQNGSFEVIPSPMTGQGFSLGHHTSRRRHL